MADPPIKVLGLGPDDSRDERDAPQLIKTRRGEVNLRAAPTSSPWKKSWILPKP
jgi:hypothetical protein